MQRSLTELLFYFLIYYCIILISVLFHYTTIIPWTVSSVLSKYMSYLFLYSHDKHCLHFCVTCRLIPGDHGIHHRPKHELQVHKHHGGHSPETAQNIRGAHWFNYRTVSGPQTGCEVCIRYTSTFTLRITDFMTIDMRGDHQCFFPPDTCSKKCKDDEMLFETIQTFKKGKCISLQSLLSIHTHTYIHICIYTNCL